MKDVDRNSVMINRLQREAKNVLDSVNQMIWFMRGSVSYTEAMNMSHMERTNMVDFIEERLESEKKNPNPVY